MRFEVSKVRSACTRTSGWKGNGPQTPLVDRAKNNLTILDHSLHLSAVESCSKASLFATGGSALMAPLGAIYGASTLPVILTCIRMLLCHDNPWLFIFVSRYSPMPLTTRCIDMHVPQHLPSRDHISRIRPQSLDVTSGIMVASRSALAVLAALLALSSSRVEAQRTLASNSPSVSSLEYPFACVLMFWRLDPWNSTQGPRAGVGREAPLVMASDGH